MGIRIRLAVYELMTKYHHSITIQFLPLWQFNMNGKYKNCIKSIMFNAIHIMHVNVYTETLIKPRHFSFLLIYNLDQNLKTNQL